MREATSTYNFVRLFVTTACWAPMAPQSTCLRNGLIIQDHFDKEILATLIEKNKEQSERKNPQNPFNFNIMNSLHINLIKK